MAGVYNLFGNPLEKKRQNFIRLSNMMTYVVDKHYLHFTELETEYYIITVTTFNNETQSLRSSLSEHRFFFRCTKSSIILSTESNF